jgi:hypothetical protein
MVIFTGPVIFLIFIMGTAFFIAPIGSDDSEFVLWHLLVGIFGIFVSRKLIGSVVYGYRYILN